MQSTARASWALLLLAAAIFSADSVLGQRPGGRKPASKPATPRPTPPPQAQEGDDLTDECPEPNGYFADGYQCDKYYECIDGAITEKLCPDGMVFNDYNTQVEKCDLPFNIDCSTRGELQKPKPSLHCPRQNGYFAHEDGSICDKFYFCVDGKFNMITCPDGLVYNERTGICTWPDEAKKAGCSSQGGAKNATERSPQQENQNQTWHGDMARGKRYTVHEKNEEEDQPQPQGEDRSEEDENFEFKDQAELEKITEEGYGKDYEDGMWEDPNAPPEESAPEDYDSADYEDKRAEEDSGSVESSGSAQRSGEEDYSDEPSSDEYPSSSGRLSIGSITGERMMLDEDGYPIFDNREFDDFDLRRWSKRDAELAEGPKFLPDYDSYSENVFKFSCPEVSMSEAQQHPRHADPDDCQFFYVCIDGKIPRRNGCKRGQVFNDVTKNCDWPRNVAECKEWYKGIISDEELEALEFPKPKNRTTDYRNQATSRRKGANTRPQPILED